MAKKLAITPCPCGTGLTFDDCCGRFIAARIAPANAEQLMRSRYTAYCRQDENYLLATWHPSSRPPSLDLLEGPATKWTSLEILHSDDAATPPIVEFVARFKINGRAGKIHEISRFRFEDGHWYYLDGDIKP